MVVVVVVVVVAAVVTVGGKTVLNLSGITSKSHTVALFVIVDTDTMFCTECLGIFMIYLLPNFVCVAPTKPH